MQGSCAPRCPRWRLSSEPLFFEEYNRGLSPMAPRTQTPPPPPPPFRGRCKARHAAARSGRRRRAEPRRALPARRRKRENGDKGEEARRGEKLLEGQKVLLKPKICRGSQQNMCSPTARARRSPLGPTNIYCTCPKRLIRLTPTSLHGQKPKLPRNPKLREFGGVDLLRQFDSVSKPARPRRTAAGRSPWCRWS